VLLAVVVLATLGSLSIFRRFTAAVPGLDTSELYGYLAIVAFAFLASAALIALRWPTVRGAFVYAWLGASVFVLLTFSHSGRTDLLDGIFYWGDALAGALAPALLVHLGITLSRRTAPARKTGLAVAYSVSLVAFAAGVWLFGLGGASRFHDPVLVADAIDRLQVLVLSIAVAVTAHLLWKSYQRLSSGLHRSQVRWILWGLGLGLAPLALLTGLPWLADASAPGWVQFLSVLPMLVIPPAFTTALVRYRLHDLDVILRRGLAEAAGILCILAIYAITKAILQYGFSLPLSASGLRYVSILVAAVAYLRARSWVRTGVDRAFYQARYSFRTTLLEFGRELNLETDLPSLAARLEGRVRETLDVPAALVLVQAADGGFESTAGSETRVRAQLDDATLERLERDRYVVVEDGAIPGLPGIRYLFGMRVKDRLRAVLATAERPDAEAPLSSEDRALLASLSAHAAAAIEAARLLREVREQARHVEALKAQQERILESSTVGLLLLADDGRILAWNRALEAIYGQAREQTIGHRLEEVFPLHLVRRLLRELDSLDPADEARIYRETLVNHAGQRIVVDLSVSAAGAGHEEGARVITVGDVTERVKLEEEVLRGERLASLGLLAAGVAHEVNTPLTGISGYVQMLLDEVEPGEKHRELLEKIEAQSRRASSIANSLLDLARPERASLEEIALNDLIEEVLGLFHQQVRGRDIRVETKLDAALPGVRAHRGKLQQVLLNLLLNARDALEAGGTITVRTGHEGAFAHFEVLDDGAGIADEDLPRIFDPFFTTKRRGRGTGLGLSISYGIVQEHGGTLSVDSVPGRSTRFRVELPIRRTAASVAS